VLWEIEKTSNLTGIQAGKLAALSSARWKSLDDLSGAIRGWKCTFWPMQQAADSRQAIEHGSARSAVGDDLLQVAADIFGGEIVLHELGDDFFIGDQVDHREIRHFHAVAA
jgi:hypothetical protein